MKIKQIFFLSCVLLFTMPLFADDTKLTLWQRSRVDLFGQTIMARSCPLYQSVRTELEQYYGRRDFSDPDRKTGWYRVNLFLQWLEKNEEKLKKEKVSFSTRHLLPIATRKKYKIELDLIPEKERNICELLQQKKKGPLLDETHFWSILATYLGARYAADSFLPAGYTRFPQIYVAEAHDVMEAASIHKEDNVYQAYINVPHYKNSFAEDLNVAIHEATHLLPWLKSGENKMVSEIGAFFAQSKYGLPVKPTHNACFYRGTRNLIYNMKVLDECYSLEREYGEMLLGLFVYPQLKEYRLSTWIQHQHYTMIPNMMENLALLAQDLLMRREKTFELDLDEISKHYPNQKDQFLQMQAKSSKHTQIAKDKDKVLNVSREQTNLWKVEESSKVTLQEYVNTLNMPDETQEQVTALLKQWIRQWQKEPDFPWAEEETLLYEQDDVLPLHPSAQRFLRKKLDDLDPHFPPVPPGYI